MLPEYEKKLRIALGIPIRVSPIITPIKVPQEYCVRHKDEEGNVYYTTEIRYDDAVSFRWEEY